jgi:hypothetical protein
MTPQDRSVSRMSDADRFRNEAEQARQMAALTFNKVEKDFWLRVARHWNELVDREAERLKRQMENSD